MRYTIGSLFINNVDVLSSEQETQIRSLIADHKDLPGGLLPLLHGVQEILGYVPDSLIPDIAYEMSLSQAEVYGVIGFYHDFKTEPQGETIIHLCRAEACQAMGSEALEAHVKQRLEVEYGGTTKDGRYTLEPVYCLGNCACSPSVRIGDEVHARVTPERFDELLVQEGEKP